MKDPKHSNSKRLSRKRSFKLGLIPMLCSNSDASTPSHSSSSSTGRSRLAELQKVFRHLDQDRDGKISGHELSAFFSTMGDDELRSDEIDFDNISHLDFGDFMKLMEREEEEDLRRAFEMFEAVKGSGRITPKGLQRVLSRLGDERSMADCQAMISVYDVDGDGELDFHEFHRMMS
ncbi:EF hand calcium-binding protein family [Rhynchospora pubera]|uniref:EF hand calcium-binding protein family n=1 Tax=Rhynchospora pubera TaxID=906938 RepID=A0AAV8CVE5_9POAL|nr:EF hand calcium-binding protein family [Rhynchospora pubera]